MRLLLTSAGIKNTSLRDALVQLLGKPIAESSALCIPTAGRRRSLGRQGRTFSIIVTRLTTRPDSSAW